MEITKSEKKIIEDALYELLYNVIKEEEKLKKLESQNIETLKYYKYKSKEIRNLIRKII